MFNTYSSSPPSSDHIFPAEDSADDSDISLTSTVHSLTHEDEDFLIETILADKFCPVRRQRVYLVKWQFYPLDRATWEPKSSFRNPEVVDEYLQRKKDGGVEEFNWKAWDEERGREEEEREKRRAKRDQKRKRLGIGGEEKLVNEQEKVAKGERRSRGRSKGNLEGFVVGDDEYDGSDSDEDEDVPVRRRRLRQRKEMRPPVITIDDSDDSDDSDDPDEVASEVASDADSLMEELATTKQTQKKQTVATGRHKNKASVSPVRKGNKASVSPVRKGNKARVSPARKGNRSEEIPRASKIAVGPKRRVKPVPEKPAQAVPERAGQAVPGKPLRVVLEKPAQAISKKPVQAVPEKPQNRSVPASIPVPSVVPKKRPAITSPTSPKRRASMYERQPAGKEKRHPKFFDKLSIRYAVQRKANYERAPDVADLQLINLSAPKLPSAGPSKFQARPQLPMRGEPSNKDDGNKTPASAVPMDVQKGDESNAASVASVIESSTTSAFPRAPTAWRRGDGRKGSLGQPKESPNDLNPLTAPPTQRRGDGRRASAGQIPTNPAFRDVSTFSIPSAAQGREANKSPTTLEYPPQSAQRRDSIQKPPTHVKQNPIFSIPSTFSVPRKRGDGNNKPGSLLKKDSPLPNPSPTSSISPSGPRSLSITPCTSGSSAFLILIPGDFFIPPPHRRLLIPFLSLLNSTGSPVRIFIPQHLYAHVVSAALSKPADKTSTEEQDAWDATLRFVIMLTRMVEDWNEDRVLEVKIADFVNGKEEAELLVEEFMSYTEREFRDTGWRRVVIGGEGALKERWAGKAEFLNPDMAGTVFETTFETRQK